MLSEENAKEFYSIQCELGNLMRRLERLKEKL